MSIEKMVRSLPYNEVWRLIGLKQHFYRSKIDEYCFSFQFQYVAKSDDISELSNSEIQDLNKYKRGSGMKKIEIASPYLKGLIIGSLWWKDQNGKISVIPPASIMDKTIIKPNFLEVSEIKFKNISNYLYPLDVPHFSEAAGAQSRLTSYELNSPLFLRKSSLGHYIVDNSNSLASVKIDFLAFYSYEIIRYFFTSNKIDDLNHRILSSWLINGSKSPNKIYDDSKSFYVRNIDTNENHFDVLLTKKSDESNLETIGNIASNSLYKLQLTRIQNALRLKLKPADIKIGLPLDYISNLKVYCTTVKSFDQLQTGLLISQIKSFDRAEEISFRPVFEGNNRPKLDGSGRQGTKTISKNNNGKGGGVKNKQSHNKIQEDEQDTNINHFSFDQLFSQESNVKILEPTYVISTSSENEKKDVLDQENLDPGGKPSKQSKTPGGGKDTKVNEVPATNYFAFFTEIILAIKVELIKSNPNVKVSYLNHDYLWQEKSFVIYPSKLKNTIENLSNTNWEVYVVEVKINGKHFYIFEKWTNDFEYIGRTWLHSIREFKKAEDDNKKELIQNYVSSYKEAKEDNKIEPSAGINHLHLVPITGTNRPKKKETKEGEPKSPVLKRKITKNEAIENHTRKIVKKINTALQLHFKEVKKSNKSELSL